MFLNLEWRSWILVFHWLSNCTCHNKIPLQKKRMFLHEKMCDSTTSEHNTHPVTPDASEGTIRPNTTCQVQGFLLSNTPGCHLTQHSLWCHHSQRPLWPLLSLSPASNTISPSLSHSSWLPLSISTCLSRPLVLALTVRPPLFPLYFFIFHLSHFHSVLSFTLLFFFSLHLCLV